MDHNGALVDLASCGTGRTRAKCFRRVHWLWCPVLHKHILPGTRVFFNPPLLHRLVGSYRSLGRAGGSRGVVGSPAACDCCKLSKYSLTYLSNLSRGFKVKSGIWVRSFTLFDG
jgi:hypothetical protein